MKLDVSFIKWRKEIEKTISEGINNRCGELDYTWTVNMPTVGTTNITTTTTTTNNAYGGGTSGNFYSIDYSPNFTTLSSSPF